MGAGRFVGGRDAHQALGLEAIGAPAGGDEGVGLRRDDARLLVLLARVDLDEAATVSAVVGDELLAVDHALEQLAALDSRKGQVVELRFFGGLTIEETALALRVSPETVMRDWRLAKAWLTRELSQEGPHGT